MPLCLAAALLLAITRPAIGRGSTRLLDAALLACLIAVAAQILPLQPAIRERLSPAAFAVDRVTALDAEPVVHPTRALSLDPDATGWALALAAAYLAVFWGARAVFSSRGRRVTIRGISWLGVGLTTLVAIQRATSPTLLYWTLPPESAGASPYGPFVNRNGLASWLAMAIPLIAGYAMARYEVRRSAGPASPDETIDSTQLWLLGSAALMTGGLVASLSRAGILGAVVGLIVFVSVSWSRHRHGNGAAWLLAALAVVVALATTYANLGTLALRLRETTEQGPWGRPAIWRDAWRMAGDFRLTGVGAGAFEHGMLAYQRGSRLFFFNHAHNEYLQLLTEGGLLVCLPATIALASAIVLIAVRLRHDRTPIYWVRLGATSGMIAIAVQSFWDTGLRTPANGILFAVIAAMALHEPRHPR